MYFGSILMKQCIRTSPQLHCRFGPNGISQVLGVKMCSECVNCMLTFACDIGAYDSHPELVQHPLTKHSTLFDVRSPDILATLPAITVNASNVNFFLPKGFCRLTLQRKNPHLLVFFETGRFLSFVTAITQQHS